jgi:hypothetical protein
MANHTLDSALATGSWSAWAPTLRRAGILMCGGMAIGASLRFLDRGSDQATALLWLLVASLAGGLLWTGISRERRGG